MRRIAKCLIVTALAIAVSQGQAQTPNSLDSSRDEFYWLGELNKAATVMVVEREIVTRELGRRIAQAVSRIIAEGSVPGTKRPGVLDYLEVEKRLVAIAGPDATRLHSGRSRQDLLATTNRLILRDHLLELDERLADVRARLVSISAKNVSTIIPAYTNGVQAQPTTLAHYLLAFEAAFSRDDERLRQAYARVNLSPLGSAALGTSSFPVDRPRLADLMGFDGVVENSYDANLVAAMDVPLEAVNLVEGTALTVGAMAEDIVVQYRNPEPWIQLQEGTLTGPSSIMPQKRNPYALGLLRQAASKVVGDATSFVLEAHNVAPGMLDYKTGQADATIEDASRMLLQLAALLDGLVVDPARALAEVNADYSTTTELANVLQRESGVPFRIGYHFASDLVTFGRAHRLKPAEIPYHEAQRIYVAAAKTYGSSRASLPMSEQRFRQLLTAENMIQSSRGMGGPQPEEVTRMLTVARARLASDSVWAANQRARLLAASSKLEQTFEAIRQAH